MMTSSRFKVSKNVLFLGDPFAKAVTLDALATVCAFDKWDDAIEAIMLRLSTPPDMNQLNCMNDEESEHNGQRVVYKSRIHSFVKDDSVFNFIDMPEHGAITGAALNKQNFHFLNDLSEIHAIVVVVSGKETHFLDGFIGTLNSVLTWLPKAAAANLLFLACDVHKPYLSIAPLQKYLDVVNADYETKFEESLNLSAMKSTYFVDYAPFNFTTICRKITMYNDESEPELRAIDLRGKWETTRYTLFAMLHKVMAMQGVPINIIRDVDAARTMLKITDNVLKEFEKFQRNQEQLLHATREQQSIAESVYNNIKKEVYKIKNTMASAELFLDENCIFPHADSETTSLQYELVFHTLNGETGDIMRLQKVLDEKLSNNNVQRKSKNMSQRHCGSFWYDFKELFQLNCTGKFIETDFTKHYEKFNFEVKNAVVYEAPFLPF